MARRAVAAVQEAEADASFIEELVQFFDDPLGFVYAIFPWGEAGTPLALEEGPDDWQVRVLWEIGERVKAGQAAGPAAADAVRVAVASGHGIGKTTLVTWIILWFISTRPNPQIVVTANTVTQLTTKTWRELAKWLRLARNGNWFQWSAQKLAAKWAPETWFASAVPWSKERAEAFAGTHEEHVLVIFDEASAIEDVIWEVAEGAMTTPGAMWIAFGNPTRNTGRFRECWRRFVQRWFTLKVDSRTAKKASQKQIEAWREDYGEDSDFFRVRVRGEFPNAASGQFIAEDDVESAVRRFERALAAKRVRMGNQNVDPASVRLWVDDVEDDDAPLILAVDVARFGDDDSVVYLRRGQLGLMAGRWNGLSTDQLTAIVAGQIDELQPDAVFVDAVGIGAGVVDQLRALGYEVIEVNAGLKALDERVYFNRRIEMWDATRRWLRKGGMIEPDQRLRQGLTAPEYGFSGRGQQMQLESKDDMKARGMSSPDEADALAMTFYQPVARRDRRDERKQRLLAKALDGLMGGTSHMAH
jgi:hypothetical protein